MGKMADFDSSGFQTIVLMLIGVLMMMLVSNVLTIISNPENIKIGSLVTGAVYEDEENQKNMMPKANGMIIVILAWIGSGGVGLSLVWISMVTIMMIGKT